MASPGSADAVAFLLTGISICLLVAGVGRGRRASLYSPLMLSAAVWLLVFVSGLLFGSRFYPLTGRAILGWLLWFWTSSLV